MVNFIKTNKNLSVGRVSVFKPSASGCYLISMASNRAAIAEEVALLKSDLSYSTSLYAAASLSKRISSLCGGECRIKVGGSSATDRDDRILRIEDGKNSLFSAIDGGLIPGGGSMFLKIAKSLRDVEAAMATAADNASVAIVSRSVAALAGAVLSNAGLSLSNVSDFIAHSPKEIGYNASRNTICDLLEDGVVDPCESGRCALISSSRLSRVVLTIYGSI